MPWAHSTRPIGNLRNLDNELICEDCGVRLGDHLGEYHYPICIEYLRKIHAKPPKPIEERIIDKIRYLDQKFINKQKEKQSCKQNIL